jgi:heme-degrading monooxygenase HmoA
MVYNVIFQGTVDPQFNALSERFYALLLPLLQASPGFISETPFESTTVPNGQVLLAQFVDAEAVNTWRVQKTHLRVERTGREKVFEGYRIRVGEDVGDESKGDEEKKGEGQVVVLYQRFTPLDEGKNVPNGVKELVDLKNAGERLWDSLNDEAMYQSEKTMLWLSGWTDDKAAAAFEGAIERVEGDSVQRVRIVRDYGKEDRDEIPGKENEDVDLADEDTK